MKLAILSKDGSKKGDFTMPADYLVSVRADVIKRVVIAIEANMRQRYGADPEAGMKVSAKLSRRRRDYRGSYGHGISRVPRKIMSRRGTRFNWVAAEAPGTVGGRRAHPPKSEKSYELKVNTKERRLAIRSAIAASLDKKMVVARGHAVPENYPFIVDSSFESLTQTKDLRAALEKIGFSNELLRTSVTGIRAGKGKLRGRRKTTKNGALFITSVSSPLRKAIANIPGFSCATVTHLNARLLAPGGEPGRLIVMTEAAAQKLQNEKLYTEDAKKNTTKDSKKKVTESKKSSKKQSKKTTLPKKNTQQEKEATKSHPENK